jgi:hypothetical protein
MDFAGAAAKLDIKLFEVLVQRKQRLTRNRVHKDPGHIKYTTHKHGVPSRQYEFNPMFAATCADGRVLFTRKACLHCEALGFREERGREHEEAASEKV